jgi:3-phenylpropionate/trans-cinnamate dioxygenase ferredoxin reductase subunit
VRVVVVGASLGGVRTVQGLRRRGCTDEIVLVGHEPGSADGVASDRPPLSKAFLSGAAETAPALVSPDDLSGLDVALVEGRATDLDLPGRRVVLHGGNAIGFDRLVLATGSSPRTVPELEPRPGVFTLRSAADATAIRAAAGEGARVVVVGGGFIGAEVAGTLTALGRQVSIVEPLPALMIRGLGPEIGAVFTRRHAAAGVDVRLGAGVSALESAVVDGVERVDGVRLTDGSRLPADVVVLGLGTVPETGWLTDSGLDLRDGVVCDGHLAAVGAEGVYAVGDLARWRHPRYGEDVRVEHWTNAVETAAVVAANLTGEATVHDSVPYVWTDQLGAKLQVFGQVRPQDELRVVFGDLDGSFVAITGGDGQLRSVIGFGAIKQLMPYRKLLLAGAGWDEALAV